MLNTWFLDTRRTFMASHAPPSVHDLEYQPEDSGDEAILFPNKDFISETYKADLAFEWSTWATLGLSVLAMASMRDPEELDCVLNRSNDPIILRVQPAEFNIIPSIRAQ
ncbi:hypothetical protein AZE42_12452, partial [Rhizopogon vesiculosus]